MTECANAEIRDQLPDLLHDHLDRDARAAVETHVATCADCRAELELLGGFLASASAAAPRIDTARIAAGVKASVTLPRPMHGAGAGSGSADRRTIARSSVFRLPSSASTWRIAATIAVMVIGGTSVATVLRRGGDTTLVAARGGDSLGGMRGERPVLSLGNASDDLTDAQLSALLSDIPKLDGLPATEPDVVVPVSPLTGNGGVE